MIQKWFVHQFNFGYRVCWILSENDNVVHVTVEDFPYIIVINKGEISTLYDTKEEAFTAKNNIEWLEEQ